MSGTPSRPTAKRLPVNAALRRCLPRTTAEDMTPQTHGDKAQTRLLLIVAFLVIAIAAINFINFTTALAPMRIKSINTQKVLGCSTGIPACRTYFRSRRAEPDRLSGRTGYRPCAVVNLLCRPDLGGHGPRGQPAAGSLCRRRRIAGGPDRRTLSGLVHYFLSAGPGTERFFRAFAKRETIANRFDFHPVHRIDRPDYLTAVRQDTNPLHANHPAGIRQRQHRHHGNQPRYLPQPPRGTDRQARIVPRALPMSVTQTKSCAIRTITVFKALWIKG